MGNDTTEAIDRYDERWVRAFNDAYAGQLVERPVTAIASWLGDRVPFPRDLARALVRRMGGAKLHQVEGRGQVYALKVPATELEPWLR